MSSQTERVLLIEDNPGGRVPGLLETVGKQDQV